MSWWPATTCRRTTPTPARGRFYASQPNVKQRLVGQTSRTDITPRQQPTVRSEDGARTLRVRQHGQRSLPLPPLMDPLKVEAKHRHRQPKPQQKPDEMTDFQRQLAHNPYAQALATPIRQCSITLARLPSHFLLPFGTSFEQAAHAPPDRPILTPTLEPVHARELDPSARAPDTIFLVNSRPLLEHLNKRSGWKRLVSQKMQERYALKMRRSTNNLNNQRDWTWDENMAERILESMRESVGKGLRWPLEHPNTGLLTRINEFNGKEGQAACVMTCEEPGQQNGSPALEWYDLPSLLGPNRLRALLVDSAFREDHALLLMKHPRTVNLQLALSRLRAFLVS